MFMANKMFINDKLKLINSITLHWRFVAIKTKLIRKTKKNTLELSNKKQIKCKCFRLRINLRKFRYYLSIWNLLDDVWVLFNY